MNTLLRPCKLLLRSICAVAKAGSCLLFLHVIASSLRQTGVTLSSCPANTNGWRSLRELCQPLHLQPSSVVLPYTRWCSSACMERWSEISLPRSSFRLKVCVEKSLLSRAELARCVCRDYCSLDWTGSHTQHFTADYWSSPVTLVIQTKIATFLTSVQPFLRSGFTLHLPHKIRGLAALKN